MISGASEKELEIANDRADLLLENMKLKDKLEKQRKEYQETYKDVRIEIKEYKQQITQLTNQLKEFKEEHKIMKQILIENGLWERLLNDDRFINYLRSDDNGNY